MVLGKKDNEEDGGERDGGERARGKRVRGKKENEVVKKGGDTYVLTWKRGGDTYVLTRKGGEGGC